MSSAREMRLRIRSVRNLAQVTKALETVSASKVRKAIQAVEATRPYAEKAWKVLTHLAGHPGHTSLHPLLPERSEVKRVLVLMLSSDRGLAGAFNVNILRHTLMSFDQMTVPVRYIAIGRKGRDLLVRRRIDVMAEFRHLPSPPSFLDVSAIGRLAVGEFLAGRGDQVFLSYTDFHSMMRQETVIQKLLPLEVDASEKQHASKGVFSYEPDASVLLSEVVPRFVAIQIYQAILASQASEHAARMIAMRNATDNALELVNLLRLEYNKARQQAITNDMLDIASGAEALSKTLE